MMRAMRSWSCVSTCWWLQRRELWRTFDSSDSWNMVKVGFWHGGRLARMCRQKLGWWWSRSLSMMHAQHEILRQPGCRVI